MKKFILYTLFLASLLCVNNNAQASTYPSPIDSLEAVLRDHPQLQENVYIQLDNQCYFVGDTIWYKAFVVKSDSLKPTNYSRILYVELLTPDGYLVERQQRIINNGATNGQFFLQDSIYSGYYEIRAYTRWDLNFNVEERPYAKNMYVFFNKEMEKDYFREFPGLYSRVVPIYEKPHKTGDFSDQRLVPRPKTRIITEKPVLKINFYPEGGNLIQGKKSRIAYEITDGDGQAQDVMVVLPDGKGTRPSFQGRGIFEYTPATDKREEVKCTWNDHTYSFKLPKPLTDGATISYDPEKKEATVTGTGAVAFSCRGRLYHFQHINGIATIEINKLKLPTGINDITVYGSDLQPIASRLIFINNHDKGINVKKSLTIDGTAINDSTKLKPYSPVELTIAPSQKDNNSNPSLCVAVYDSGNLPLTYDDNNIMTSILLSGELKGFVPNPSYYFEKDDAQHRKDLDLLMMVQGWRKYKRTEKLRYMPEFNLTYEGEVFNVPTDAEIIELNNITAPLTNTSNTLISAVGHSVHNASTDVLSEYSGQMTEGRLYCPLTGEYIKNLTEHLNECQKKDNAGHPADSFCESLDHQKSDFGYYEGKRLTKHQKGKEIKVEAELVVGKDCAGVAAPIDQNGHFKINMPWFYDDGTLFVTAYKQKDSVKMSLGSYKDKKKLDETQYPDYYVKRDVFFPRFCKQYSWYQCNAPDDYDYIDPAYNKNYALSNNRLAGDHYLANVTVRKHSNSKRALNYKKPAIKIDAYRLYNEVTDAGLSYGVLDMNTFTQQASVFLFGYLDQNTWPKIKGMTDSIPYFRNYFPQPGEYQGNMAATEMLSRLRLNRMQNIMAYSDYDKRKGIRLEQDGQPAVTIRIESIPDDGRRYTFRDRHYTIQGITYAWDFYNFDYSNMTPEVDADGNPKDYRRTLYWNPNAKLSEDGKFHATLYNNSRETRVKISAAGMDKNGQIYY